ncbi:MAG: beta-galactosidase, partial [Butyrivibrio sp.]|nr:beta-galactosidase [Butyrivibrio sp.]
MKITANSVINVTPEAITVDGKAWFPVMGEMHFSRYPTCYWEEELCKMKSGGVDIVSLYTIWMHHEEVQGEYEFGGQRDLRRFLETIKKCGLYCILRIGPWAHGEVRNGGFPDWLLKEAEEKGYECRTNAPEYMAHVRDFYTKIFEQAKGLFIKDGGPVIGVQIENEYGHVGGKTGEEGEEHMRTLHDLALELGFDVPIFTATGWGGAVTGGMTPVMGGYCEAPWDQRLTEIEPSGNYVFTKERNDHNIGSDHGFGFGITFDIDKYPFLTAELGGGIQVTHHRRPVATGRDIGAMSMTKLGCGVSLLGYYMYHGGTNPDNKLTTLQECRETGYPNDLPVLSYDFNAPLKEYGQLTDTYREIRRIAMFTRDFGSELCHMKYVEQPGNTEHADDLESLRSSVRCHTIKNSDGEDITSGFFFVNNYQRRYEMAEHRDEELKAYAADGKTVLASFEARDVENGDYFFYPFNMPIGKNGAILKSAMATPLCILKGAGKNGADAYVFYTDNAVSAQYDIEGDLGGTLIVTLTRDEALHASKVFIGGIEHLIISEGDVVRRSDGKYELYTNVKEGTWKHASYSIWPDYSSSDKHNKSFACQQEEGSDYMEGYGFDMEAMEDDMLSSMNFAVYATSHKLENTTSTECTLLSGADKENGLEMAAKAKKTMNVSEKEICNNFADEDMEVYDLKVSGICEAADEVIVMIDHACDSGEVYVNHDGKPTMIADNYYTGQKWEIGLKRFISSDEGKRLTDSFEGKIKINALHEDDKIYLQEFPRMEEG